MERTLRARRLRNLSVAFACVIAFGAVAGCESEPKRSDIRTDAQRVDKIREDKVREDKTLPTWKAKEKAWWEF